MILCTKRKSIPRGRHYPVFADPSSFIQEALQPKDLKMSYRSFAEYEFDLIDAPAEIRTCTYQALEALSEQGHSGGSFSFFGGALRRWCENPQPIEQPDSLLKPFWELAQHWEPEQRVLVAGYLARLSHFEPLSRVFRTGTGPACPAYILDAHIFYEPNSRWDDWVGWTTGGGQSSAIIEFPFDLTKFVVRRTFYTDSTRRFVVPDGIDARKWIDFAGHQFRSGYSPHTHQIIHPTMFVRNAATGIELMELFFGLMQWAQAGKLTVGEALEKLSVPYLDVLDAPPVFVCEDRRYCVTPGEIASNLIRLCESVLLKRPVIAGTASDSKVSFEGEEGVFSVIPSNVQVPNRYYTRWETKPNLRRYVLHPLDVADYPTFFMDSNMEVGGDEDDYLYQMRRQKGLKHPKRRNAQPDAGVAEKTSEQSTMR
jgi:hypothetical protein